MISSRVLPAKPQPDSAKPKPLRECFATRGYNLAGVRLNASLPWPMQAKLEVGGVDDPLEREADSAAEHVMRMPEPPSPGAVPGLQRKCSCDDCKEQERVQRKPAAEGAFASTAPPIVHEVLRSAGQPLDPTARSFFEPRFGHDFSRVRVHTDAQAAESARAVHARAYTVGQQIVFGPGQYGQTGLMAHELAHVVQQSAVLRRQPETTVHVGKTDTKLPLGAGGSGAVIYEYTARAMKEPPDKKDPKKPGKQFDINLPLLVYPPANLDPAKKVDVFVFFHGMRATYEEGTKAQASQGGEPIAIWTQLKEAVGASGRLGIAPQAPATWVFSELAGNLWVPTTAQWGEALEKVGFDGLINIALQKLSDDLGLTTPLVAGDIHVAGHSAGGHGIIQATREKGGAKTFGDQVQDLTLQDAGYGFGWGRIMDWLLDGSPGKTVRVLMSDAEGAPGRKKGPGTRSVLSQLNVSHINDVIKAKKKTAELEAVDVPVPKPEDQKPRPGGFVLESEFVISDKTTGDTHATIVVFFAPGGQHYPTAAASMAAAAKADSKTTTDFLGEATPGTYRIINDQDAKTQVFDDKDLAKTTLSLDVNTEVEVTTIERKTTKDPKDKSVQPYVAKIKMKDGTEGWVRMTNLTRK